MFQQSIASNMKKISTHTHVEDDVAILEKNIEKIECFASNLN